MENKISKSVLSGINVNREKSMLSDLLAIIHRDGGHYEDEHGTEKAFLDAVKIVSTLITDSYVLEKLRLLTPRAADLPSATCPRCKNSIVLDSCPFCNALFTASR